jgi:hypothetical protein
MKHLLVLALFSVLMIAGHPTLSSASWLYYYKPEFKGKVIDAESEEPIAGAVVVATYYKSTMGVPHRYSSIINVQETLTNQNGEFFIPSYTTIIQPLSVSSFVHFIIYKPGYGNYPFQQVNPPLGVNEEDFFSETYGKEDEIAILKVKRNFIRGVVELPKLITKEERDKALSIPNLPLDYPCYKIRNLILLLRQEYVNLGYKDYESWMEDCK